MHIYIYIYIYERFRTVLAYSTAPPAPCGPSLGRDLRYIVPAFLAEILLQRVSRQSRRPPETLPLEDLGKERVGSRPAWYARRPCVHYLSSYPLFLRPSTSTRTAGAKVSVRQRARLQARTGVHSLWITICARHPCAGAMLIFSASFQV